MQEAENYQIQWGHEIMKALKKRERSRCPRTLDRG